MAATTIRVRWIPADTLARLARIAGPDSSHQQALDELLLRRAAGEDVFCYSSQGPRGYPNLLVGPRFSDEQGMDI